MTAPQQPYRPGPPPKKSKTLWIVLGIIAVVLLCGIGGCVAVLGKAGKDISAAVDAAATSIEAAAKSPGVGARISYEVTSDSTLASVSYFDENNSMQSESTASAPWSKSVTSASSLAIAGVTAQTNGTTVTCRVTVDGVLKEEQTATGQYAVVNCTSVE